MLGTYSKGHAMKKRFSSLFLSFIFAIIFSFNFCSLFSMNSKPKSVVSKQKSKFLMLPDDVLVQIVLFSLGEEPVKTLKQFSQICKYIWKEIVLGRIAVNFVPSVKKGWYEEKKIDGKALYLAISGILETTDGMIWVEAPPTSDSRSNRWPGLTN